jgi:hypothetical protein
MDYSIRSLRCDIRVGFTKFASKTHQAIVKPFGFVNAIPSASDLRPTPHFLFCIAL